MYKRYIDSIIIIIIIIIIINSLRLIKRMKSEKQLFFL